MITINCKQCNKEKPFKWQSQVKTFCSKKCYNEWQVGRTFKLIITDKERQRRKKRMTGKLNPMWKGGDSDKERRNADYKNWRIDVFKRDKYICQDCGYYNGNGNKRRDLNAHHIVRWIDSIELRYEIDNGKTLCVPCHIKEHTDRN